jgi:hypothetical protein
VDVADQLVIDDVHHVLAELPCGVDAVNSPLSDPPITSARGWFT